MKAIVIILFWSSIAAVFYTYIIYPLLLCTLARLFGTKSQAPFLDDAALPAVSILIAAHNEEDVIEARIRGALASDYPPSKLEIVIASDSSSDQTAGIVRRFAKNGVRLLEYTSRRGKADTLNAAIQEVTGQVVMLSDANTHTDPSSVRSLVRWFADPRIGAVCGRLVLTDPSSGKNADGLYWKYETFLKKRESELGALLGSNGAIYAIRRKLFPMIPAGTIVEDLVVPLLAKLRSGCDVIYDGDAVAHEESAPDVKSEFHRRCRIGAGGWQAMGTLWPLLDPRRGWIAFTFFSHKILRWLCPFCLVGALIANTLLATRRNYLSLLAAQVLFYLIALCGGFVGKRVPLYRFMRLANMFVSMNAALLLGFFRWLGGAQGGIWARTRRATFGSATNIRRGSRAHEPERRPCSGTLPM